MREQQQRAMAEELAYLDRLCNEARSSQKSPNIETERLQKELDKHEKLVKDALLQKDVFTHMIKRLTDDVLEVKRVGQTVQEQLVNVDHELQACGLQLQNAKQELKNEEQKYNRLQSKVQSRRQMQEDRFAGIQRIIQERSSLLEKQEERMRMREHVMARSKFDLGLHEEQRLKRMHVVRKVYSSMLEKKITAEEEDLGSLETTFQQIKIVTGLSDVDDIVQKFKYRSDKTKQLETVAEDVRLRIEALREENHQQRAKLEGMRADCEVTAGNREIFQEMDKYNSELGDALRQCEESKARAIRSSVTLEELKSAVARFRSKVENQAFPPPTDEELPEYLRELDLKLTAKMKAVSEALNQDDRSSSAPTPTASAPDSGKDSMLPFAKLQSDKLKKMLYHKMMLTVPDSSPRNVRVTTRPRASELDRWRRRGLIEQFYDEPVEPDVSANVDETGEAAPPEKEDEVREPVVDRDTVKRLSNLIAQQSNPRGGKTRRSKGGKGRDLASPSSSR